MEKTMDYRRLSTVYQLSTVLISAAGQLICKNIIKASCDVPAGTKIPFKLGAKGKSEVEEILDGMKDREALMEDAEKILQDTLYGTGYTYNREEQSIVKI